MNFFFSNLATGAVASFEKAVQDVRPLIEKAAQHASPIVDGALQNTKRLVDQVVQGGKPIMDHMESMSKPLLEKLTTDARPIVDHIALSSQPMMNFASAHPVQASLLVLAATAPVTVPIALSAVGFGSAGPIAASLAASWQSQIGMVQAGSLFASLQSAGMTYSAASLAPNSILAAAVIGGAGPVVEHFYEEVLKNVMG